MATKILVLARAEQIGASPVSVGDYIIYNQSPDGNSALPWVVDQVSGPRIDCHRTLGAFASKTNALTFVLAHESTGWEDGGALRHAAVNVLRQETGHCQGGNMRRLALALEASESRRPRALIVVEHGLARVHATPGVDAVVVNLDTRREFAPQELLPVHADFTHLLEEAGVQWPRSPDGRHREAAWPKSALPRRQRMHLVQNGAGKRT